MNDSGGPPWGVGGGWMGLGGSERLQPTHVHAHECAHTCMCMHMHACVTSTGIPRDSPNGGSHLHELTMITMHVCAYMLVHLCGGTPNHTPIRIHPPPPPRAAGSRRHQNSITLELIKIIRFCLKILHPLNIPELI